MDGDSEQVFSSDLQSEINEESTADTEQPTKLPWEKPVLSVLEVRYTDLQDESS